MDPALNPFKDEELMYANSMLFMYGRDGVVELFAGLFPCVLTGKENAILRKWYARYLEGQRLSSERT